MADSHKTALDYANENARYWSARGIKLPMASRIVNKLLGVNLKLDDQKIVNETEEIIRLLEAK